MIRYAGPMNTKRSTTLLLPAFAALLAIPAASSAAANSTWSATWGTAQAQATSVGPWQNQTLRMVARTSLGGTQLRIHLSNVFATSEAVFTHVSVGIQQDGAWTSAVPVPVTFAGSPSVSLAPGQTDATSDPVALAVTANTRLLVSLYIPPGADITSAPIHQLSNEEEYDIVGSDATALRSTAVSNTFGFTSYLSGIDVDTKAPATVVAVGDSITDGQGALANGDTRWTDYLADRVADLGYSVANEGISADWVTQDRPGIQSMGSRWSRDVLSVPGVRTIIDTGGINDLRGGVSAATLEAAQDALIAQAHAAGVRVILSTLTPCGGDPGCPAAFETQREIYNSWVFSGGSTADGVADFNGAVMGTADPFILNASYDSGDHLHPNAAGDALLAACVPTALL